MNTLLCQSLLGAKITETISLEFTLKGVNVRQPSTDAGMMVGTDVQGDRPGVGVRVSATSEKSQCLSRVITDTHNLARGRGKPVLAEEPGGLVPEVREGVTPSEIVQHLEWPGIVSGVGRVDSDARKLSHPRCSSVLWATPRSLDCILKDRV